MPRFFFKAFYNSHVHTRGVCWKCLVLVQDYSEFLRQWLFWQAMTCTKWAFDQNQHKRTCLQTKVIVTSISFFAILCNRPDICYKLWPVCWTSFWSPFLSTAPLQYVPKIIFTQATIDSLINNKTKTALHSETVIFNHIGVDLMSYSLSNEPFIIVL